MTLHEETMIWQGTGASAGVATGKARIIRSERDFAHIDSQDILVSRHATPALYPSMVRAKAAICETGGRLCHLAVLAREMGKPCVTGLPKILDLINTGARIHVDGTKGTVEVLASQQAERAHVNPKQLEQDPSELVPIIQFGIFSRAFEYVNERFDIDTITRAAALISLPMAFHVGTPMIFSINKNQVLVDRENLLATKLAIVEQIENGLIKINDLHQKYMSLCTWEGWSSFSSGQFNESLIKTALNKYVFINQATWLACIVKEEIANRYRKFLVQRLPGLSVEDFNQVFLKSLIMPGSSYILRYHLEQANPGVWYGSISQKSAESHKLAGQASSVLINKNASTLKEDTLTKLKHLLDKESFQRVVFYISTLATIVDLTERKNTDLCKCGKVLFAKASSLPAFSKLFGFATADIELSNTDIEYRKILIEKMLSNCGGELGN